MNRNLRKKNPWIFIIIAIVVLSFIFTMINQHRQKDKLDVYTQENMVVQEDLARENEQQELMIETQIYTDSLYHYSIEIPKDWVQTIENDSISYVHKASGSTIRLETYDYDPRINNVTSEGISAQIAGDGKTFVNFTRKGDSCYEVTYQDKKNSVYDYIEEVFWDRSSIIRIICIFNDMNYEKILPYYQKSLESFSWDPQDEIPIGYALCYIENENFEFGYPDTWVLGTSTNAIVATDNTSSLSLTKQECDFDLSSLTATEMSHIVSQNKQNVMMNSFTTSENEAAATLTYVSNNVQITENYYIFYDGSNLYCLAIDYEKGMLDENIPPTIASLFRSFNERKTED